MIFWLVSLHLSTYANDSNDLIKTHPVAIFQGMSTSDKLQSVVVMHKDYNGKRQKGMLMVPEVLIKPVKTMFNKLLSKSFLIQLIKPYSKYSDVYEALKDNASFMFVKENRVFLVINPVDNPFIVRGQQPETEPKKIPYQLYTVGAKASSLAVYPARGVLAVNRYYTDTKGQINTSSKEIFKKYGFKQTLNPNEDDENQLYFGLLEYGNKNQKKAKQQKSPKKQATGNRFIFKYGKLPDEVKKKLINTGFWKKGCPVPPERLNYVQFGYHGFDGKQAQGSIVSADVVAPEVLQIFTKFFEDGKPIETPGGAPNGGTGMFRCRQITGGGSYSLHPYGTALDLSYYRNPYIGIYQLSTDGKVAGASLVPEYSKLSFLNRDAQHPGFNEKTVSFITSKGFAEWGGTWLNRTDYMHFQTSPFFSYLFPIIDYDNGRKLFLPEKTSLGADAILHKFSLENTEIAKWQMLAKLYPANFAKVFIKNIKLFDKLGEDRFYTEVYSELQSIQH